MPLDVVGIDLIAVGNLSAGVGVHLALAAGQRDVDETASVSESLLRTALGSLLLLLLLDLGGLRLDLSCMYQSEPISQLPYSQSSIRRSVKLLLAGNRRTGTSQTVGGKS
jgi:hypothetical protein